MTPEAQKRMTPAEALALLKAGNERFAGRAMQRRELMAQVQATAAGQYPFAVVLGCIDSRVPPELVFDQGIGELFCPRVAGNIATTEIIGSIEFATKVAGAKAVAVLGHTACGAVKGACDRVELGNLTQTLSHLTPAVDAVEDVEGPRDSTNDAFVQAVAVRNVQLTVAALTERSAVLRGLVDEGQLEVVGAMYDVGTGRVSFID